MTYFIAYLHEQVLSAGSVKTYLHVAAVRHTQIALGLRGSPHVSNAAAGVHDEGHREEVRKQGTLRLLAHYIRDHAGVKAGLDEGIQPL